MARWRLDLTQTLWYKFSPKFVCRNRENDHKCARFFFEKHQKLPYYTKMIERNYRKTQIKFLKYARKAFLNRKGKSSNKNKAGDKKPQNYLTSLSA